jgi:hypothetical protein
MGRLRDCLWWTSKRRTIVRYSYRRLTVLLRREGWHVNAMRIYRLYAEEGLIVRAKQRRKIAHRQREAMLMAAGAKQRWSMEFVTDKLADGRSFAHSASRSLWSARNPHQMRL